MRTIAGRIVNFCWFWFKWGLIACVIGAALMVPYFYHRLDEEIRVRVESHIARHYPGLKVTIRSAVLVKGEGIQVRGLSILDPAAEGPGAELFQYDECFLACQTDLAELVSGEPLVTRVAIRRPTLRVTRRPDGTWSAAKLLPVPRLSGRPPEVTIENGTIEVFDPLKTPSSTLTLRDVNLTLAAPAAPGGSAEDSPASGSQRRKLQGTLSGDYFRQVIFEGEFDPHRPELVIGGSVEGMEVSPELRGALPGSWSGDLSILGSLRGQAELNFRVCYDPAAPVPWEFDLSGRLVRGRIDDVRLPHPLTEIRAFVHVNNEGFTIEDLSGRSNQASLQLTCRGQGLGARGPMSLEAQIRQLELDHQLLGVLPEHLQEQWHKYRPEGRVDVDVKLSTDGQTWNPEVRISCLNVSFTHHKFPYRLEHGKGTLCLKDNLLQASLTAYAQNQLVRIDAEVRSPLSGPVGWVEAKGEDLSIDQKLLVALSDRPQALARAMDLRGTIDFKYRLGRDSPREPFHQSLSIRAKRCWMRYEHFAYSISNIRGTLEMIDGNWSFRNLEGNNGTCQVVGEGTLTATPDGNELLLHLGAKTVALEEELRDALQPAMRHVWSTLKPRGIVDLVADLRYVDRANQFDVSVRIEPRSETCSIEPVSFPYRLEKLQGILTYRGGRVALERFKGEHGPVKLAAAGYCDFQPDGGWNLHLEGLTVDRLRVDRELMQAMPARLKKVLGELSPTGPIQLRGTFDLGRGGSPEAPICSQWNLLVGLQQASLDCGIRLENINGTVALAGGFDGQNFSSLGELSLDSVSYKDFQFTQVLGPLWMDDQQALLGSWVDRRAAEAAPRAGEPRRQPRPLTAKLCGGAVYGDAWVALGPRPRYSLRASIVDADLPRCAREVVIGRQKLQGRVHGNVELRGFGRNCNTLAGHGSLHLRDADVYELPVMISMLKLLSIRAPDSNAFSKSDIDFRVEGEHIYFDKIDFNGDAISLLGKGEMNFQGETRLTFTAIVGRGELGMPVLRNIFKGASQQFMLIHVGGTLQNPETRKEAFPGVNQALQQLQQRRAAELR